MTFSLPLRRAAEILLQSCQEREIKIAIAESCTGGLTAALLTEISGASTVFERGFVTYSNEAKMEMLGVDADLIETHGAVSDEVAKAMAEGALSHSNSTITLAVTGIAGPEGGTADKPVGLVHFGVARRDAPTHTEHHIFSGNRAEIRLKSLKKAIYLLSTMVGK